VCVALAHWSRRAFRRGYDISMFTRLKCDSIVMAKSLAAAIHSLEKVRKFLGKETSGSVTRSWH